MLDPVHRLIRRPWTIRACLLAGTGLMVAFAFLVGSIVWVDRASEPYIHRPDDVPGRPVAVVFGSQVYGDGTPSPILVDRLETARQLYVRGKVQAILVTGDNGQPEYNEVDPMRAWLITRNVPEEDVVGDYAGFDSYSSCQRAVRVFGVKSAILVTQRFHLPRAVTLCRNAGMDALGAIATNDGLSAPVLRKLSIRDKLACVKAAGQMIYHPDPKYLGRHEDGVERALRN